jgi:hypothetical protein
MRHNQCSNKGDEMPAYKNLSKVLVEASKIFVDGNITNDAAFRAAIKSDIKKALTEKSLTADEFEARLKELLEDRLYSFGRMQKIGAPYTHALDYDRAAEHIIRGGADAYVAQHLPSLTTEIKYKIKNIILSATPDTSGEKEFYAAFDNIPGILLRKINNKKMSFTSAIKFYHFQTIKNEIVLEYYRSQVHTLPQEKQNELKDKLKLEENQSDLEYFYLSFYKKYLANQYVAKLESEIREEIKAGIPCPASANRKTLEERCYFTYADNCFPDYNANWINGSNVIAMQGAASDSYVAVLMQSLLFSETMKDKPQVTTIIALGNCLRGPDDGSADFYNYCFDDRDPASNDMRAGKTFAVETNPKKYKEFDIELPYLKHSITVKNRYASPVYTRVDRKDFPSGFVSSELNVSGKKLDALLIAIPDGHCLDLEDDNSENIMLKELLWKISQKSSQEATAVHCMGGIGRTGHMILTLEIIKNYQRIFASDNPAKIAQAIQAIVDRIRENRVAMIASLDQYLVAIQNADLVYQYALDKKYVTEPAKVSVRGFLTSLTALAICKRLRRDQEAPPVNTGSRLSN